MLLVMAVPAAAQDSPYGTSDYGGGWASPSLDLSLEISRDVLRQSIMNDIVRDSVAKNARSSGGTAGGARPAPPASIRGTTAPGVLQTRFVRSKELQKQSEASILAELGRRQPGAVAEYAQVLRQNDMATLFDTSAASYGLKSNDIADTMAAYWLVSWVIANNAADFTPAQARGVREQIRSGMMRTAVVGFTLQKKHRLADEAIFNTLIASAIHDFARSGKITKADFARVGDATQKTFLGLGADLRALRLTDSGFQLR